MARLRDEVEELIDAWDAYEKTRGSSVIDYDARFRPTGADRAANRLAVLERVSDLLVVAEAQADHEATARLRSDQAYLEALLGHRHELAPYLQATQGASASGWSDEYIGACGQHVKDLLAGRGISWGKDTPTELRELEGAVQADELPDAIRAAAAQLEPTVRAYVNSQAPFDFSIETVSEDAYWSYWLDGAGSHVRLRLNTRNLSMSHVGVRQFALHEVLGHGLQYTSLAREATLDDVSWPRVFSVHGPQQCLFEGLAQALPLFVTPDDESVRLRVRLDHYRQLVCAKAHLDINAGRDLASCVTSLRTWMPFWSDETIGDVLHDRARSPQLRSYLWSYPAGLDWFLRLSEQQPDLSRDVVRRCYARPFTPQQLQETWPNGPTIGAEAACCSGRAGSAR